MSKIAVCYFSYHKDIDFLNESLKHLQKTIERHSEHEVRVYVFDDGRCDKNIKKKELVGSPTLIATHFNRNGNLNGFECIYGMFTEYAKISQRFEYDYLIKLDSDCVLNTFDYILAVENRLKKNNLLDKLGQIGSYFAQLCCYGCCQTFTRLGVGTILNLLNHMAKGESEEARIMKKRVEVGWNEDKVVSVLMEMSPVIRAAIDVLEGIKGHVNAFEKPTLDWSEWTSVAFKPNHYGQQMWSRERALEKMKEFVTDFNDLEVYNPLETFVRGKKVAVVGNAEPVENYSEEIDSADVVIRINNFYNYQSDKVGKRVDALVLSGLSACMFKAPDGRPTQDEIIAHYKPHLFLLSETANQNLPKIHPRYDSCIKEMLGNRPADMKYTTGTILLKMLSEMDDVDVRLYCFDSGHKWNDYINTFAKQHVNACESDEEDLLRQSIIKKLNEK